MLVVVRTPIVLPPIIVPPLFVPSLLVSMPILVIASLVSSSFNMVALHREDTEWHRRATSDGSACTHELWTRTRHVDMLQ